MITFFAFARTVAEVLFSSFLDSVFTISTFPGLLLLSVATFGADFFPPRRMLIRLRFMARHIICVKSRPDAPTIPPTATRNISLIAIPAIEPATPERELSSEIVIGMSAPPTRTEK